MALIPYQSGVGDSISVAASNNVAIKSAAANGIIGIQTCLSTVLLLLFIYFVWTVPRSSVICLEKYEPLVLATGFMVSKCNFDWLIVTML